MHFLFPDLTEEFGSEDGGFQGELPEGRHCRLGSLVCSISHMHMIVSYYDTHRVENKNFYFDIGQNNRGVYMRIRLDKQMTNNSTHE